MRLTAIVAGVLFALTTAAPALAKPRTLKQSYSDHYYAAAKKLGKRAPGRNIRRDGVRTKRHRVRDATNHELAVSLRQLRRLLHPPAPQLTAGPPPQAPSGVASTRVAPGSHLAAIGQCESGGDYGAISPGGQYRGKYQFDYRTWGEVGGTGDPAAAPPAEQDRRAAMLYSRAGPGRWPVCGG